VARISVICSMIFNLFIAISVVATLLAGVVFFRSSPPVIGTVVESVIGNEGSFQKMLDTVIDTTAAAYETAHSVLAKSTNAQSVESQLTSLATAATTLERQNAELHSKLTAVTAENTRLVSVETDLLLKLRHNSNSARAWKAVAETQRESVCLQAAGVVKAQYNRAMAAIGVEAEAKTQSFRASGQQVYEGSKEVLIPFPSR